MAASARLPMVLLGGIVLAVVALTWKPWQRERSISSNETPTSATSPEQTRALNDSDATPNGVAPMTAQMRDQVVAAEKTRSALPQAQPPSTYLGPDGKQHEIAYNQGLSLSPGAREQLKRELLAQMKQHPEAVSRIYRISLDDITAVVAGTKPFPEKLLDQ